VAFLKSNLHEAWPDFATTGAATSYAALLASFPFFLVVSLVLVWSIASVGPARKLLSSAVILVFVAPAYPIIAVLVVAIFWIVVAFAAWALAVAGPLFLVACCWVGLFDCRPLKSYRTDEEAVGFCRFTVREVLCSVAMGLAMSLAGLCTFAVCAYTLTLHESPASHVTRAFVQSLLTIDKEASRDIAVVGFVVSYAAVLISLPYFLSMGIFKLSASDMGKTGHKPITISFVIAAVALYPVLTAIALALLWVVMSFAFSLLAIAMPIYGIAVAWHLLWIYANDFIEQQRELTSTADDITFCMLFFGFAMGLASLCTFGLLAVVLTLLKSPVVFVCCIGHAIYHTIPGVIKTGGWCPLAFFAWCFAFVGGLCALLICIALSALTKLVVAAVWPAYIATGWLRFFGGGGRRREEGCCTPLVQGIKAGYQVLWASDLLTNAVIMGDYELFQRTVNEFAEIATGRREQLSPECRKISILPPVIVGLFLGSWDLAERAIAKQCGLSADAVREAWTSLREQMVRVGKESLETGLLTDDYVLSVPPELVIGLPARVLLDTIERSSESELVLASGLRIHENSRPQGQLADKVWHDLQEARGALADANLGPELRIVLRGTLLAGGGDPSELTPGLAYAVQNFDKIAEPTHEKCMKVRNCLISLAVEFSRQRAFREQLEKVIQSIGDEPVGDAAFNLLLGIRQQ